MQKFSTTSLVLETPKWAKIMFRIVFLLTTALTLFIAGTTLIDENIKYELMLAVKSLDVIIYGVSKMFGIEVEKAQ